MSTVSNPQKKKKPPACDRCKAKRVLCHPDPRGCPRCIEKGIECTTTPVVRRKPRKKTDSTPRPPSEAPLLPVQPETTQAAGTSTSSGLSLEALLSAAASPAVPPLQAPGPLTADSAGIANPALPASALIPFLQPAIEITPTLAKHLFDCFAQTPHFSHPVLETPIRDTLESKGWNVDLLPLPSRALAYSIFALSALVSYAPEIVGRDEPSPTSFSAVQQQGPDLRSYGRRRKSACLQLRSIALGCAREADVMLEPTLENTATCVLLNALADLDDQRPLSRPFNSALLSHIRSMAESALVDPLPMHAVQWGCYLAVHSLSDLAEGRYSLTRFDELLFVGGDAPDPALYAQSLAATLNRPVDRGLWPDLKPFCLLILQTTRELTSDIIGAHARRRPVNEHGFLRNLERLHHLRTASQHFCAIMDRLLEPYKPIELNLFPGAPVRSGKVSRIRTLEAMRGFTIWTWTGCVLPFYRELQRRSRLNHENPESAFSSPDPPTRYAAERLDVYLKQAREICFFALEAVVGLSATAPVAMTVLNRRGTLLEWAEFLLEEIEGGTTPYERCRPLIDPLIVSLQHYGYVVCTPALDDLISRLAAFLLASQPQLQPHSLAPSDLSTLDLFAEHQPHTPPFTSNISELPIPPSNPSFLPTSTLSSSSASLPTVATGSASVPFAGALLNTPLDVLNPHTTTAGTLAAGEKMPNLQTGFFVDGEIGYDSLWPVW